MRSRPIGEWIFNFSGFFFLQFLQFFFFGLFGFQKKPCESGESMLFALLFVSQTLFTKPPLSLSCSPFFSLLYISLIAPDRDSRGAENCFFRLIYKRVEETGAVLVKITKKGSALGAQIDDFTPPLSLIGRISYPKFAV